MIPIKTFIKNYWLLITIWLIGLFFRCYRQNQMLSFYYDQGRDALMATDIINFKHFPAIGPTTGIQGLLLGPLWYYLITPGYLLSRGNPAYAAWFISLIESFSIPLIYLILEKYWHKNSGYLGAFFWSFSYYLIRSSRWFSNPSPLPTVVFLLILCLIKIFQEKKYHYSIPLAFLLGVALQLEAASAIFFFPIIGLIALLNFSTSKKISYQLYLKSFFAFFILLIPQILFEFKNKFIVTQAFLGFLTGKVNSDTGKSWAVPSIKFVGRRLIDYYEIFFSKLDTNTTISSTIFLIIFTFGLFFLLKKLPQSTFIQIIVIWLFLPLVLLLFFVGNYGTLYDYYLTGLFPAFFLLFTMGLTVFALNIFSLITVVGVIGLFINGNLSFTKNYITAGTDGPSNVSLGNEILAVDYVCQQYKEKPFTLNIYVPPVIPYSYNYLFYWRTSQKLCSEPKTDSNSPHLSLYEIDPDHPSRLNPWLNEQEKIGKIVDVHRFGGIIIQSRTRSSL
ncbi:glycosyltransferase family 39 protein [Candidatus Shapirobacteria bacterium]|nr:glycosyltransferase family 39 protein [Candidatus Shapirobacteria bacterium]